MICSKDEEKLKTARLIRSYRMDVLTFDRHKGRAITYDVIRPGLNYRIDAMKSALGLVQVDKLEKANQLRKKLVERYIENLKDCKKIKIPFLNLENIESVYHIFSVLLDEELDR